MRTNLYQMIINRVWRLVSKYRRYLLVVTILLVALTYGKNINPGGEGSNSLINEINSLYERVDGKHTISPTVNNYPIKSVFETQAGRVYRVFFSMRIRTPERDFYDPATKPDRQINLVAFSPLGQRQVIKTISFNKNEIGYYPKRFYAEFTASDRYTDLLIEKASPHYDETIIISDIETTTLLANENSENETSSVLIGTADFSKRLLGNEDVRASQVFSFESQKIIGQVFKATESNISSVDLRLNFVGEGGRGSYFVELREVEDLDSLKLGSKRLAYYYFNRDSAEARMKIGKQTYRFPLGSTVLEPGKYYLIGVGNEMVSTNIFQYLEIYGTSADTYSDGWAITIAGQNVKKYAGDLSFKLLGADLGKDRVLVNETVQDIGGGRGLYKYRSEGNTHDYFDLYKIEGKSGNKSAFYDSVMGGISGSVEDEASFTYRFNIRYPINRLQVLVQEAGGLFVEAIVSYSFDEKNWTKIDASEKDPDKFESVISGSGLEKVLFIKVTYDREDTDKPIKLFGIRKVEVNAELSVE